MTDHLRGCAVDKFFGFRGKESRRRRIGEDAAQAALAVLALDPGKTHNTVHRVIDQGSQELLALANFALRFFDVTDIAEHEHVPAAQPRPVLLDVRDLHVQEATRIRHHLFWLACFEGLVDLQGTSTEQILQGRAQRLCLLDRQHALSCLIEADNAHLLVDDDHRVLHRLEHGFVSEWRELDDLSGQDQVRVDRQQGCKYDRHVGDRVGPDTEVVQRRGDDRADARCRQQEQAAALGRRHARTVGQQREYGDANHRVTVRQVDVGEPGSPLGRKRQELARAVDKRPVPHHLVIDVGRRQRDRNDGHD